MEPLTETTTTTPPDFFDVLEEEWRTCVPSIRNSKEIKFTQTLT